MDHPIIPLPPYTIHRDTSHWVCNSYLLANSEKWTRGVTQSPPPGLKLMVLESVQKVWPECLLTQLRFKQKLHHINTHTYRLKAPLLRPLRGQRMPPYSPPRALCSTPTQLSTLRCQEVGREGRGGPGSYRSILSLRKAREIFKAQNFHEFH